MSLSPSTWTRRSPAAAWDLELPCTGDRAQAWPVVLDAVLQALGDLGDAARFRPTPRAGEVPVSRSDLRFADLEQLGIDVDLHVRLADGPDAVVERGMVLWLEWEDETERASPMRLLVSLEVDLYARRTWGASRENDALAALNQPRLAGFLSRLRALGGRVHDVDAPSYRGQVGPDG